MYQLRLITLQSCRRGHDDKSVDGTLVVAQRLGVWAVGGVGL